MGNAKSRQLNAAEKYYEVHVQTTPKDQLLILVLDGAIRLAETARDAIQENDFEKKNAALGKAQSIVLALQNALSPEVGDRLYKDLRGLYFFVYRTLVEANFENSLDKLAAALKILSHVRETWRDAVAEYRNSVAEASPQADETERDGAKGISESG